MRKRGKILILLGLLLMAAALCLSGYNLYDARRASASATRAVAALEAYLPTEGTATTLPGQSPEAPADYVLSEDMEMPVQTIDGIDYIGVLRIPALSLELPVISRWSYPSLKIAPCRYSGSAYRGDLVVCAHNYASHFGNLSTLQPGDTVTFTDMDGNEFSYCVAVLETLPPTATEEMTQGDWALTLFTCTVGGRTRVVVRCDAE